MFERARQTSQASQLPFLAALVVLVVAIMGFEARAQEASQPASQDLQLAAVPGAGETQEESGDWVDYDQSGLALGAPVAEGQGLVLTLDAGDHVRVARIASCREASLARYESETRYAPEGPASSLSGFHSSITRYSAEKASQRQFDSCTR